MLTDWEWINKICHIQKMEFYLVKKDERSTDTYCNMDMFGSISKKMNHLWLCIAWFYLCEISKLDKSIVTERRVVIS